MMESIVMIMDSFMNCIYNPMHISTEMRYGCK